MVVRITETQFWDAMKGAKRPPEIVQPNNERQQLIIGWRVNQHGTATRLMVKVYTSIFGEPGHGITRGVAQDSIRVCLVDTEHNVGVGKATFTQRTEGWQDRLIEKVAAMFTAAHTHLSAGEPPRCLMCNALMGLRTATRGKTPGTRFWGCLNFPRCRGTRPYPLVTSTTKQPDSFHQLAAQRSAASRW
jgi:hypothetical protein